LRVFQGGMSKAKWTWLASLLLAAYALAYVSWVPPHARLVQAYPMNATHFTAYVNNTTVYIAQAGLSFRGSPAEAQAVMQYLYSQCRYVAVDVHDVLKTARGTLWLADVYCSRDGSMWLWLRWLPLRFTAYSGYVEYVNATNATAVTPVGTFTNYIPAGWYLDPATKAVFKIPEANITLLANLRAAQAENERLRSQLAQLKAENDQLKAQLASMNQTVAKLNAQLSLLKAQLAAQTSGGEEGVTPLTYVLFAALAGIAAAFVIYKKKKKAEE